MRKEPTLAEDTNGSASPQPPVHGEAAAATAPPPGPPGGPAPDGEPSLFWHVLRVALRRRKLIAGVTFATAVLSVVISLFLPLVFSSSARVLIPDSDVGGLGALIGDLSPIGASLLGGGGGDYSRYLSILTSRSLMDETIEQFDLVRVYETDDAKDPLGEAREQLASNTRFEVDMKYDFLEITVFDRDPRRSADLANFLVEELNRRHQALSSQNAGGFRRYVEARYARAELELDSLRGEMQRFQEAHGVVELPTMTQAFLETAAEQRAQLAQAEIQYEALLAQFGPDNPEVAAARDVVAAARRAEQSLLSGGEQLMPVPLRDLPALGSEYARLYQELLIQAKILESSRPLLEQARFEEERERTAVQVVDRAVPPVRKAKPKRAVVVIATTASAFLLVLLWVLGQDWLRRSRRRIAYALQAR